MGTFRFFIRFCTSSLASLQPLATAPVPWESRGREGTREGAIGLQVSFALRSLGSDTLGGPAADASKSIEEC